MGVQNQYIFFETDTVTFLTLVSRIETDPETLNMWSQDLRLRPPKSKSQSQDQSLAQLCCMDIDVYFQHGSHYDKYL